MSNETEKVTTKILDDTPLIKDKLDVLKEIAEDIKEKMKPIEELI